MSRISDVQTICLSRLHETERQWVTATYRTIKADCAIVVVTTEDGTRGFGEACAYGAPNVIADWVGWYRKALVGRNLDGQLSWPHTNGQDWGHDTAVAGIDCALWDLRRQACRQARERASDPLSRRKREDVRLRRGELRLAKRA